MFLKDTLVGHTAVVMTFAMFLEIYSPLFFLFCIWIPISFYKMVGSLPWGLCVCVCVCVCVLMFCEFNNKLSYLSCRCPLVKVMIWLMIHNSINLFYNVETWLDIRQFTFFCIFWKYLLLPNMKICWFFIVFYDSKLSFFGFWTVDRTKQAIWRCQRSWKLWRALSSV